MKVLMVLNRNPYDGTDVTWNALRLGEKLLEKGVELKVFLMNDSIDLAREGIEPPAGYFNLTEMLAGLIAKGVPVKICGTCLVRCGIHKGKSVIKNALEAKMPELAEWIVECDKVISF
ncbi:MAG: DsrE family protein [Dehalococcoidales bacterium]|nr:DsrE family protein [Dehalococcoidales bacterium]